MYMWSTGLQSILIFFLFLLGWWWFAGPWLLWLTWQKSVWPLVCLAIIWDAYTGGFFRVPLVALSGLVIGWFVILIKPRFLVYNQTDEVV